MIDGIEIRTPKLNDADCINSFYNVIDLDMVSTYAVFFPHVQLTGTTHMIEMVDFAIGFVNGYPSSRTGNKANIDEEKNFCIARIEKFLGNNPDIKYKEIIVEMLETLKSRIQTNIKKNLEFKAAREKQEQEKREKELQEKVRIDSLKKSLRREIILSKKEIGNLTPKALQTYASSYSAQDFDALMEHLRLLEEIKDEEKKKKGKQAASDHSAYVNFLISKKIYAFAIIFDSSTIELDNEEGYFYGLNGISYAKPNDLLQMIKYISYFKKGEINSHYQKYADLFAVIVIYIFGSSKYSVQILRRLIELKNQSEIDNESLDNLLKDLSLLDAVSDDTIYRESTQKPFELKRIITLAKENKFFSGIEFEIEDDILRQPFVINILRQIDNLFIENGTSLGKFFKKRKLLKKCYLFRDEYNSGLDLFGRLIKSKKTDCAFVRDQRRFRLINGYLFEEGLTDRVDIIDRNNHVRYYKLIETRLATYIRKQLEFYLLHKDDTETCDFKYDYDHYIESLIQDKAVPEEVRKDFKILTTLVNSNAIRDTIAHAIRSNGF